MNKIFFLSGAAALALVTSGAAQAQNYTGVNDSPLSGAYLGGYGGYGWTDGDNSGVDPEGMDYGLFAGYKIDEILQRNIGINGAIEAFYGWSNADDSVGGVNFEKDHEWGVNFRPGISISDTINPYGIIGYRNANFEASTGGVSADENYDGFELGIGTELVAYGDVGIRLDYSHIWYNEENGFDPSEDDIRLGAAYHF